MKAHVIVLGAALFAASPLAAQTNSVTTDPVGYITVPIVGTGGSTPAAYTFLGLSMIREASYQGALTGVGAFTLIDTNASWVEDQFNDTNGTFTVELAAGTYEGYQTTISNTVSATKTLEIVDDFSSIAAPTNSYRIYKDWTLASVFGVSNSSGLAGGTATTADQILIRNDAGYDIYYYQTSGIGGVGWRKSGTPLIDRKDTPLFIEQGLLIKRLASPSTNLTIIGAVKVTPTVIPAELGYNFIANVYPVDMTLASSQLYTGNPTNGVNGGSSTSADQVQIRNGALTDLYYYQTQGIGGIGWRKVGSPLVDASTNLIPGGICFVVKRSLDLPFMWKAPKHPVQ